MEEQNSIGEPLKEGQKTQKAKKTKKKSKQTEETQQTKKEDISHLTNFLINPPKDLIMSLSQDFEDSGRNQVFNLGDKPYCEVIKGISSEDGGYSTFFKVSSKLSGVYNVTKTLYEAKFEFYGYTSLKDKVAQEEKGITKKSQLQDSEKSIKYIEKNSEEIFKTNEFKEHLEDLKKWLDTALSYLREGYEDICLLKKTIAKAKNLANSCIEIDSKDLDRLIKDVELMGDSCSELSFLSVDNTPMDYEYYGDDEVIRSGETYSDEVIPQEINKKIKSILLEIFVLILPMSLFKSKTKRIADLSRNDGGQVSGRMGIERIYNLLFRESEDINCSKYLLYRIHKKYSNSSEDGFEFKNYQLFIIDFLESILNESKSFCSLKGEDLLKEFPQYKNAPENILGEKEKYFSEAQEIVISHFKKGFKDFIGNPLTSRATSEISYKNSEFNCNNEPYDYKRSGVELTFYLIFSLLDIPEEKYADAFKNITLNKKEEIYNRLIEIGL